MGKGLFGRAAAYLNLSPAERATLRLLEGLTLSAGIAGVQAAMPLLNAGVDPSAIPWPAVLHTFIATAMGAFGSAGVKYLKAQGDPALPPFSAGSSSSVAAPVPSTAPAPAPAPALNLDATGSGTVPPIVDPLPAESGGCAGSAGSAGTTAS
jgi:hypothetical protein